MSEIKSPDIHTPEELLLRLAEKRNRRRKFFKNAGGLGVGFGVGTILAACGGSDGDDAVAQTPPPAGPSDADVLNFALNLEYLEAQFYLAALGQSLDAGSLTGTGTQGGVTGGRAVTFMDPLVAQYAREIAADERAHVLFLRQALGSAAVAQPALDIGPAFAAAGMAAGLGAFDPYVDDNSFLLGAYIFEDVGVTAYKGASPLITNKTFLEAAAGILAAEAYHAGLIRTVLYARGMTTTTLIDATEAISNARDSLDSNTDVDQGVRGTGSGITGTSNIVPLDNNGIAFSRTTGDVLNIVYLTADAATSGGFFPAGVNGTINMSSAIS